MTSPECFEELSQLLTDFFKNEEYVKKLFFPAYYCQLNKRQYNALKKTVKKLGLSMQFTEELIGSNGQIRHDFDESYVVYSEKANGSLDNQLYDESRLWKIVISHEDFAILGCTKEFFKVFQSYYLKDDREQFITYWENESRDFGCDITWVDLFLKDKE